MANTIILKRSSTPSKVPTTAQLALGEVAINTYDGRIFIKKDNGTPSVVEIGGVTSVNSQTGAIVLGSDNIAEGSSNLYFTQARARAALSAGSGISYNSSTGAISTTQGLTTTSNPTFASLTLTGGLGITGSIIPSSDVTYDLGSPTKQWKDIYVGPGSLYVNGQKVLQDDSGTITFSADLDENIRIKTLGTGVLQLGSSTTNINVDGTLQMASGKRITDAAGVNVQFGNPVHMNSNKIINLGAPSSNTDAATKKYVDDAVGAVSTSSIAAGNSNISVVDTGTGSVQVNVDGSTALTVTAAGVVVAGNFTVQGTTTTVESNTISLADNIITLNSDTTGTPTQNAGVEVERGDEANVQLRWNEGSTKWTFTNNGAVYYPMAVGTDDLAEGTTNLYHTTARARNAVSVTSNTGISYNSTTGVFNLGSIPNSSLTYSKATLGSTDLTLGSTTSTLAGMASITSSSFTGQLTGNADTATALATGRTIAITGDITYTSPSFNGSGNVTAAATLATVNANVGAFGSATAIPVITVNGKGLVTAVSTTAVSIPSGALTFTGDVTGTGTTGSSTALTIATGAVTNAKLANSSVTIGSTAVSLGATASTVAGLTLTSPTINAATIGGHLVPSTDLTYDLGDATHRFRNLYLSGSTIAISGSTSGTLTLAASAVAGTTTVTFPATTGTVITTGDSGTVTNTMLAGSIATSKITGLATSATTDTTSATNITSGTLPNARLVSVPDSALATISTAGKVSNSATTATNANTASAIVARDASGNFTAGTITASLTGNVTGNVTGTSGSTTGNAATVTNGVYTTDTGTVTNTMLAGSIADTKLSTISTAGKVSNSATTAASANTASAIVARDASGNFTAGTITANLVGNVTGTITGGITGNAATATALATARTINGVSFDGSANVTVHTAGTGISISGASVAVDTSTIATKAYADSAASAAAAAIVASAPAALDTLNELATALGNDASFATTTATSLGNRLRVDTAAQGLTGTQQSNARTNLGLATVASSGAYSDLSGKPTNVSSFTNDSAYITTAGARSAVSFTAGSGAYNSTTGAFTIPTNTNQLTNGAGFITGYTETDTLATVTARGATTTAALSTGALTVTGGITATGEITAYYSDANLKKDIAPIQDPIGKVMALSGVTFRPNDAALALGIVDKEEVGVIAQDVEAVLPQLVVPSAFAGYKTVKYDKLTALLLEAVKVQQLMIENLQAEVTAMKVGKTANDSL